MPKNLRPPEVCPVCGEDVPPRALACPECGADHETGWREDAEYAHVIEEDEFDYDEFMEREFGKSPKPQGLSVFWWIIGIILAISFAYGLFFR